MNCEEFGQRMHERLDGRLPLDHDADLSRHADVCESCRAQIDAWRQIATVFGVVDSPKLRRKASRKFALAVTLPVIAGLAAGVLLAFTGVRQEDPIETHSVAELHSSDSAAVLAQANMGVDPVDWWHSVQERDWVGQTMPAVQSVREGVAPLGRTLMRAVTMLTIGGQHQTS